MHTDSLHRFLFWSVKKHAQRRSSGGCKRVCLRLVAPALARQTVPRDCCTAVPAIVSRSPHLDLLDDLTEGRSVPDTVLPGDPDLLRALTLRQEALAGAGGKVQWRFSEGFAVRDTFFFPGGRSALGSIPDQREMGKQACTCTGMHALALLYSRAFQGRNSPQKKRKRGLCTSQNTTGCEAARLRKFDTNQASASCPACCFKRHPPKLRGGHGTAGILVVLSKTR